MKKLLLDSPHFLEEIFHQYARAKPKEGDPLLHFFEEENAEASDAFDKTLLQDSWSWRNVTEARKLALQLINEKGEVDQKKVEMAIGFLENTLFSLGLNREQDGERKKHLLNILKMILDERKFLLQLGRVSRPIAHPTAEQLIRETLLLPSKVPISDADAKKAVFSALLTMLRQNVGSCFATAPAILIQQEFPLNLLSDMHELLGTGRLTRIYGGIEQTVPLSHSWGIGDLNRPFYLASFGRDPWMMLSHAPGILAGAASGGILETGLSKEEKISFLYKKLLKTHLAKKQDPFVLITANQLFESLFMDHYEVTRQDIHDYENRPKEFILPGYALKSFIPQSGKTLACSNYFRSLQKAQNSFKALTDNALLKAWEFTLASFAETKAEFAKWNLSASLGLSSDSPYGIGQCFYAICQEKVDLANQEIEERETHYGHIYAQIQSLETRIRSVATESDANWIQAEYRMRRHEIGRILAERDQAAERARKLSSLPPFLHAFYSERFQKYFQEIYDPEMHDVKAGPYDDSPAGFRLLYKHGRANTSQWTLIHNSAEYIEALSAFFIATEVELSNQPQVKGLEHEISELVTAAVLLVKREEFLEHSFYRLASAYGEPTIKEPLQHLDQIERKPWAYISGGTMTTLISAYFGGVAGPDETSKWVENETELLAFFLETMKDLHPNIRREYREKNALSMLAFSPTHAFLFQPGRELFLEGWETDLYSFTWIRDKCVIPGRQFYHSQLLDARMMDFLMVHLENAIPPGYRHVFKRAVGNFSYSMSPSEFRSHIIHALSYEKWASETNKLDYFAEEIDSLLYTHLPLFPEYLLKENLEILFRSIELDSALYKEIFVKYDALAEDLGRYKILSSSQLKNIAKGLLILATGKTKFTISFHDKLTLAMQEKKLACPRPVLFADTNWVKNLFGFVVSPGTDELELWRFDFSGSSGRPMTQWKKWVNGKEAKAWGVFISPHQYRF